jgi:hypothetical protein
MPVRRRPAVQRLGTGVAASVVSAVALQCWIVAFFCIVLTTAQQEEHQKIKEWSWQMLGAKTI